MTSPPKQPRRGYQRTRQETTAKPIRQEMTGRGRRCARPRRAPALPSVRRGLSAAAGRRGSDRERVPGRRTRRRGRLNLPEFRVSLCAWSCAIRAPTALDLVCPLRRKGRLRRGWGVVYAGPEIGRLRVRGRRDDGAHVGQAWGTLACARSRVPFLSRRAWLPLDRAGRVRLRERLKISKAALVIRFSHRDLESLEPRPLFLDFLTRRRDASQPVPDEVASLSVFHKPVISLGPWSGQTRGNPPPPLSRADRPEPALGGQRGGVCALPSRAPSCAVY